MRRFLTPQRTWPTGQTMLHLYLMPDLAIDLELAALIGAAKAVLSSDASLSLVAGQWLHTTVQSIRQPAATIGSNARAALVSQLTAAFTGIAPFTLRCGPPLATSSAVILDQDGDEPGHPLQTIVQRARGVIADMFGTDTIKNDAMPPHMSLAYGISEADSGAIASQLRTKVRPSSAPMSVNHVHLVDVMQDAALSEYRWETVAHFPLAT